MEIICYKTGNGEYPENSIQAIENCTKVNINWIVHIELQLTKDNKVILFSANNTERTTGKNFEINKTNFSKLKDLDIAYNYKQNGKNIFRNKGFKIVSLEKVFNKFPITKFILDLKSTNKKLVFETIKLIEKYNMSSKVILSSKHDEVISFFKEQKPDWEFAATTVGSRKVLYENMFYIDNIIPEDADILIIPKSDKGSLFVREKIVEYCKHRNKQTWTWIFEDSDKLSLHKQVKDLEKIGIDGVYTSFPMKLCVEFEYQNENIIQTMYKIV